MCVHVLGAAAVGDRGQKFWWRCQGTGRMSCQAARALTQVVLHNLTWDHCLLLLFMRVFVRHFMLLSRGVTLFG